MNEERNERESGTAAKDDAGGDDACEILTDQEHFAAHGHEQVIVQTFFQHFAAEQLQEHAHAAEKYGQAQIKKLEHRRKDEAVAAKVAYTAMAHVHQGVGPHQNHGRAGESVDPDAAFREEILFDFEAQDGEDLRAPERPGSRVHMDPPSGPIRYS